MTWKAAKPVRRSVPALAAGLALIVAGGGLPGTLAAITWASAIPARGSVNVGPPSSWITEEAVYCNQTNTECSDPMSGRHVVPAPTGYDRRRDCQWIDSGFSASLRVDKHYCVALHG